jgi:precorrin isomerase
MSDFIEQFRVQRLGNRPNDPDWLDVGEITTDVTQAIATRRDAEKMWPTLTYRIARRAVITSGWGDYEHSSRFADVLLAIVDALAEIASDAEDCGEVAITHKIEEGIGRINNAHNAAIQYFDGTLEPR